MQCPQCLETVEISSIFHHTTVCEKRTLNEVLSVIHEETAGTLRGICKYCKRRFALDRIDKHQSACENVSRKRPLFDMLKKRIPYLNETKPRSLSRRASIKLIYPNSKWQKQHLDLLRNLRHYEEESNNEKYMPCPHCFRRLVQTSAEKHIESCKNTLHRQKPLLSVVSQRFPSLRKGEEPLTIHTNSMKSLWVPSSVDHNSSFAEHRRRNTNLINRSSEEAVYESNITVDVGLSPVKIMENINDTSVQSSLIVCRDNTPLKYSSCMAKISGGTDQQASKYCKLVRPSKTVKDLVKEERPVLAKISREMRGEGKRSNSTLKIEDCPMFCSKCHARIPQRARFCMMCGTLRIK